MRQARMKAAGELAGAFYHCVSRVVDRQFLFGDEEKAKFVEVLRRWEAFCGVRVLTYCVMSNHFHVLVEVPKPPLTPPSDETLIARVQAASGALAAGNLRQMLERLRTQCSPETRQEELAKARATVTRRMWDISAFMKAVKQQFTQWYNGRHGRSGTLWEGRFKSVLVEGAPHRSSHPGAHPPLHRKGSPALVTMACYIDLNPVRAGIVQQPGLYRWCGYGEALGGQRTARDGLRVAVEALVPSDGPMRWDQVREWYTRWMNQEGTQRLDGEGTVVRRGRPPSGMTLSDALQRRVRYFCDGAVLGSAQFVETVFRSQRWRFGPHRQSGARPLRRIAAPTLRVLRDLRVHVIH